MGVEEVNRKENPAQSMPFMSLFVGLEPKSKHLFYSIIICESVGSTSVGGRRLVSEICLL